MTPEKMFHEQLELGMKWEVVQCELRREVGKVYLSIRETEEVGKHVSRPKDEKRNTCYDHIEEIV